MDNGKYMKRCYELSITEKYWRKPRTQQTGRKVSSVMPNSTWSINARTGILILS